MPRCCGSRRARRGPTPNERCSRSTPISGMRRTARRSGRALPPRASCSGGPAIRKPRARRSPGWWKRSPQAASRPPRCSISGAPMRTTPNGISRAPSICAWLRSYPHSDEAADGRFRAPFALYMLGRFDAAAHEFAAMKPMAASPSERDGLAYWHARSMERSGQSAAANAIYQSLAQSTASNYYPELAARRIGAPTAQLAARVRGSDSRLRRLRWRPALSPRFIWTASPR